MVMGVVKVAFGLAQIVCANVAVGHILAVCTPPNVSKARKVIITIGGLALAGAASSGADTAIVEGAYEIANAIKAKIQARTQS